MTTIIWSTSTAAATTASPSAPPTTALPTSKAAITSTTVPPTTALPTSKAAITSTTVPPTTAGPATTTAPITTVISTTTFSPSTTPVSTTAQTSTADDDASSSAPISSLKDETQKNIEDVTSILEEENIDPESEIGKNLTSLLNLLQGLSSGLDSIGGSSSRQKRDISCAWVNRIIRQYNSLLEASPLLQSHGFKKLKWHVDS